MSRGAYLAVGAVVAVAGAVPAAADAARGQQVRPPSLLWRSYPLKQKAKDASQAKLVARQAHPPAATSGSHVANLPLATVALAALLAVGTAMLLSLRLVLSGPSRQRAPPRAERDDLLQTPTPSPQTERTDEPVAAGRATRARPKRKPKPPPRERRRPAETSLARCEIKLWRGFVKCQLYAAQAGSDEAIALSRYFRLRDDQTPTEAAEDALWQLVERLERDGWTLAEEGRAWYQLRFERPEQSAASTRSRASPAAGSRGERR